GDFERPFKRITVCVRNAMESCKRRSISRRSRIVFIRHIFVVKPLVALALLVCMGTIIALFKLNRRKPQSRSDQFLIAFLSALTIYEAIKILREAGVLQVSVNSFLNDAIELLVAGSCLVAAILLQISRQDHLQIESAMRLARAAPPRVARPDLAIAARDIATFEMLAWGLPRLSDGAFKLLAILCLRSDAASGRVPVGVTDVQLKLGKSKEELDTYLKELQETGAVNVTRNGPILDIEIATQSKRSQPLEPAVRPAALVTESRL
ncbi:MAG TPA: hypothetical protein VMT64_02740, partial [Candidatus Binataceae bacterium]|nr:hypothetical protein [Candidatus Binataceae bacterium]